MILQTDIHILDLDFLDESMAIASFLIPTSDGLLLIESGPDSTFEHLVKAIEKTGFDWKDIKHVLLTHIHFDHAGAAWRFAENGAKIYVHPIGLPHLQNPEKLWNSAAMIYGDDMDRLWGEMKPIKQDLLTAADDGDILNFGKFTCKVHYTPGHAVHHNAYQFNEILFTGDVAGVKIDGGIVVPPCPPPDINIELWKDSLGKIKNTQAEILYLTHFGTVYQVEEHLNELESVLDDWANWMKPYFDDGTPAEEITPKFMAYTNTKFKQVGLDDDLIKKYEYANPSWMSVAGLLRYWKLKEQGRI